jgi:hypothetical protein
MMRNVQATKRFHYSNTEIFRRATAVASVRYGKKMDLKGRRSNINVVDRFYNAHIAKPDRRLQVNLFDHDFLFFPVNDEDWHWYTVVVIHPQHVMASQEEKLTGYVVLDPMKPGKKLEDRTGV